MAAKQKILYQKKIDVIGYKNNDVYIVEVKPNAGSSALGQVLSYKLLYQNEFQISPPAKLMIITDKIQNGYEPIFRSHQIMVHEVGN